MTRTASKCVFKERKKNKKKVKATWLKYSSQSKVGT